MNPAVLSSQSSGSIFVTFVASFLIWLMFAGLLVLWIIDGKIKKEQVLHALFATLVAWTISQMIKSLIPVERPFEVNGDSPLTLTVPNGSAFPSSHATAAFALAGSIWTHDKKLGLFFLLMAFGVAIGRVVSNVHYALDVMAGALIGAVVAGITHKLHLGKMIG